MNPELRPDNVALVTNGLSGMSRTSDQSDIPTIRETLIDAFPKAPVIPFRALQQHIEALRDHHAIVLGGDGSISVVAKVLSRYNSKGAVLPIQAGTMNMIARAHGFSRLPKEDPTLYAKRIASHLTDGVIVPREIYAGRTEVLRQRQILPHQFVFRASVGGPILGYMRAMESLRGKVSKPVRVLLGLMTAFRQTIDSPTFSVSIANTEIQTQEAFVLKAPYTGRWPFPTQLTRDTLMLFPQLPTYERLWRLTLDGFDTIVRGKLPTHGAIVYKELAENQTIHVYHHTQSVLSERDSELIQGDTIAMTATETKQRVIYRFGEIPKTPTT